jgi:pimeloyl-ACP methyl ester carboxylesterase
MSDGAKIAARLTGCGRPIAFVHGWAMNGDLFERQRRNLCDKYCVLTYDLRGHGGSAARDGRAPTIEQLGADLAEIFEQLRFEDAICVGWSIGAMAVWEAMAQRTFAARVAGLVVIDMSPRITNDASWSLGLSDGRGLQSIISAAQAMRNDWPAIVRQFVPSVFAPGANEALKPLIESIVTEAEKLDPEAMAGLWESMAVQDFRKAVASVSAPMLIARGALSQLYAAATSEFLARASANAEVAVFAKSGHAPHIEEPDAFNQRLRQFIARVSTETMNRASSLMAAR